MDGNLQIIKDRPKIAAGIDGDFFVKLYKMPGIAAQISRRFRSGRAVHCLFAAEVFQNCGAMTPPVVAALELHCGKHICDFLITEKLPENCRTLNYFLHENDFSGREAWNFIVEKSLPEIARIHNSGIIHGDLNLRNLYPLSDKIGFIDLDSAICNSVPADIPARDKELARLLSGFLRFKNFKDLNIDELASELVVAYKRFSPVQCCKENIIRRANYLLDRLYI